jgi:hypothetical protein
MEYEEEYWTKIIVTELVLVLVVLLASSSTGAVTSGTGIRRLN